MANHVYFNIEFDGLNEDQERKLMEILKVGMETVERDYGSGPHEMVEYSAEKFPIYSTPYEDDNWYSWGVDNMGAKWVHIEEVDVFMIAGYSAWSHPWPLVENLCNTLAELTESFVSAKMTYEDEFRNFFGVDFFCSEFHDDEGWCCTHDEGYMDGEELTARLKEMFGEKLDNEDFDWWDGQETVDGNILVPQEFADELVYDYFSTGEWK